LVKLLNAEFANNEHPITKGLITFDLNPVLTPLTGVKIALIPLVKVSNEAINLAEVNYKMTNKSRKPKKNNNGIGEKILTWKP